MPVSVTVRYFALLRDLAGKNEERLDVEAGADASQLYRQLAERYAFPLALRDVRVAVNDEFAPSEHVLRDGDRLVFIPPVAGG
jgi:molybdopterin converting factor subunit 1